MVYEYNGTRMFVDGCTITWTTVTDDFSIVKLLSDIFTEHRDIDMWIIDTAPALSTIFKDSFAPRGTVCCPIGAGITILFFKSYSIPLRCDNIALYLTDLRYAAVGTELHSKNYKFTILEDGIDWVHTEMSLSAYDNIIGYYRENAGVPCPVCALHSVPKDPIRFAVDDHYTLGESSVYLTHKTASSEVEDPEPITDPAVRESKYGGNRVVEYLEHVDSVEQIIPYIQDDIQIFYSGLSKKAIYYLEDKGFKCGQRGTTIYYFHRSILQYEGYGVTQIHYPFEGHSKIPAHLPRCLKGSEVEFRFMK